MPDIYTVPFSAVATVAATAKTVVQVLAGTRRLLIAGYRVGASSGTSTDAPIAIRLATQTTAGTMSAGTITARDPAAPAALASPFVNASAEPTTTTDIDVIPPLAPQGAPIIYDYPLGDEPRIAAAARVGMIVTSPQAQSMTGALIIKE